MSKWDKVFLEANLVKATTSKAILFKMPSASGYGRYSFWHPASLCKLQGKNGYLIQLSFTEEFEFILKQMGTGKYNFNEVIDEKKLSAETFKEVLGFGMNKNLLNELMDDE